MVQVQTKSKLNYKGKEYEAGAVLELEDIDYNALSQSGLVVKYDKKTIEKNTGGYDGDSTSNTGRK